MGYRPSYILARAAYRMAIDPSAFALIRGYAGAALRGESRYPSQAILAAVRDEQRFRRLYRRFQEAVGVRHVYSRRAVGLER